MSKNNVGKKDKGKGKTSISITTIVKNLDKYKEFSMVIFSKK